MEPATARLTTHQEQDALNLAASNYVAALKTFCVQIYGIEKIDTLDDDALAALLLQQAMTGVFNAMPPDSGFGARFTGVGLCVGSVLAQVEPPYRDALLKLLHRGLKHALIEHEPLFAPQGSA